MFQMQHAPGAVPFPAAFGCDPISGVGVSAAWDAESAALAGAWQESRADKLLMDFEQDMVGSRVGSQVVRLVAGLVAG